MTTFTRALRDEDRDVRYAAAMEIGKARALEHATDLVGIVGNETDASVNEAVTWALAQLGEPVVDLLIPKLADPNPIARAQAAHVLSKIKPTGIAQHLAGVIADEDNVVAIKGFRAATTAGDAAVIPALVARLGSGNGELQDALQVSFAHLGDKAVPALVEALRSDDPRVRADAADVLGRVGSPDADGTAADLAALLHDPDVDVRLAAVSALGQLDREKAGLFLRDAVANDDATVRQVASALLG